MTPKPCRATASRCALLTAADFDAVVRIDRRTTGSATAAPTTGASSTRRLGDVRRPRLGRRRAGRHGRRLPDGAGRLRRVRPRGTAAVIDTIGVDAAASGKHCRPCAGVAAARQPDLAARRVGAHRGRVGTASTCCASSTAAASVPASSLAVAPARLSARRSTGRGPRKRLRAYAHPRGSGSWVLAENWLERWRSSPAARAGSDARSPMRVDRLRRARACLST